MRDKLKALPVKVSLARIIPLAAKPNHKEQYCTGPALFSQRLSIYVKKQKYTTERPAIRWLS